MTERNLFAPRAQDSRPRKAGATPAELLVVEPAGIAEYRQQASGRIDVFFGMHRIGMIYAQDPSGERHLWSCRLPMADKGEPHIGSAPTREIAQREFARHLEQWAESAGPLFGAVLQMARGRP